MPAPRAAAAVRARIGFTSISYVNEVFPRVFYEMAPPGVVLSTLDVQLRQSTPEEMKRIHTETLAHARTFAAAGCDVVFLGGAPTNLVHGWDHLLRVLAGLEEELGVPVTSNATAQNKAMLTLGAQRVGVVHPFSSQITGRHDAQLQASGLVPAGCIGADSTVEDYHLIAPSKAYDLGVALKRRHPELDTLFFACPHWYVAEAIEPLEKDLGVNVVAALQAIVWQGMRLAGVDDRVGGYGRLLREH